MTLLDSQTIELRLANLPGWSQNGDALTRSFDCATFPAAIAFVTHIGFLAEAANHHPDIDIRWRHVDITLSTHDEGGITENDLDLADEITAIFVKSP